MKLNNIKKLEKFKESSFLKFFEEQIVYRIDLDDDYTCDEIYRSYEAWCIRNGKCVDSLEEIELILKEMGMDEKIQCDGKTYYRFLTLKNMKELINLARLEQLIDDAGTEDDAILIYVGEKYNEDDKILDKLINYCIKKNYYIVDTVTIDDIKDEVVMQYELEDDRFLLETLTSYINCSQATRIVTLNSRMISIDYDLLEKLFDTLKNTGCKLEFMEK